MRLRAKRQIQKSIFRRASPDGLSQVAPSPPFAFPYWVPGAPKTPKLATSLVASRGVDSGRHLFGAGVGLGGDPVACLRA